VTSSPHDALFRFMFSRPEHAAPLIRSRLPPELARSVDWSSLELQPGSFVDRELEWRHTDLLFGAKLDGRDALVYVLVEHQSTPDPLMPLRVLRYIVRIWDECLRHDTAAARLPAVLPIVVYHGRAAWTAPLRLRDLSTSCCAMLCSSPRSP
jgi:predicted transposase/invertase (TIGR01784 family)